MEDGGDEANAHGIHGPFVSAVVAFHDARRDAIPDAEFDVQRGIFIVDDEGAAVERPHGSALARLLLEFSARHVVNADAQWIRIDDHRLTVDRVLGGLQTRAVDANVIFEIIQRRLNVWFGKRRAHGLPEKSVSETYAATH